MGYIKASCFLQAVISVLVLGHFILDDFYCYYNNICSSVVLPDVKSAFSEEHMTSSELSTPCNTVDVSFNIRLSLLHFQSWIGLNSCCLWTSAFRIMGLVIDTDDLSCFNIKKKKSPLQPFLQVVSTLGYGPLLVAFVIWKTSEWNSTQIHLWEKFQQWAPSKLKCLARIMVPKADLFSLLQVGSSPCF